MSGEFTKKEEKPEKRGSIVGVYPTDPLLVSVEMIQEEERKGRALAVAG